MVKPGQTLLDVGINVNLVPGGVGSVTDSVLAMHTIEAAETAAKKDGVPMSGAGDKEERFRNRFPHGSFVSSVTARRTERWTSRARWSTVIVLSLVHPSTPPASTTRRRSSVSFSSDGRRNAPFQQIEEQPAPIPTSWTHRWPTQYRPIHRHKFQRRMEHLR